MPDDAELLRRYADSASEEAFAELVRRHLGTVYGAALRRVGGDVHLAQDVTQEVFADLARKAGSLAARGVLVGWLFVAARFAAAKAVRRDRQRQASLAVMERHPAAPADPDWESLRPALDQAIDDLKAPEREAILLYYFEQRTYGEVGRLLAVTESGARMRVDRALEKLRFRLGRRGITSSAAALATALGSQALAEIPSSLAAAVTTSALATVPTGAATTLLLMAITKTQLAVTLALVVAGTAYLGVMQQQQIGALQAANRALAIQAAAASTRAEALARKLRTAASSLASAKLALSSGTSTSNGVRVVHMKDIIKAHPEYVGLERKEMRHNTIRSFGRAIEALKLPPDQASRVKELLVERDLAGYDARAAAEEAGIAGNTSEMEKAYADAEAPLNQALDALLGPDGRGKLEALRGYSFYGSGNGIDDLSVDLMDAGYSLPPEEIQTLAQMQHDLEDAAKNPAAAAPGYRTVNTATWERPLDQDFFAKAATLLSPDQLQVVKTSRTDDNQRQAIVREFTGNQPSMIMD